MKRCKLSVLSRAGDEASRLARRQVLLAVCGAHGWNLSRVAETLQLTSGADVIRALKDLAPVEYAAARAR